jgi:general secretion pathway protein K
MNARENDHRKDKGSVLLIVLWLLVMLTLIAHGLARQSRDLVNFAATQAALAQMRHAAQAGTMHGILRLLDRSAPLPARTELTGEAAPLIFGMPVDIAIRDECGKVDLNTAWGAMVTALIDRFAPEGRAGGLSDAVLDWRDPDDRPRVQGAERSTYAARGRVDGPANGPFESVDELHQVLDMDARTASALRPYITVDCLNAGIDPLAADAELLRALPSTTGSKTLESFLDSRLRSAQDPGTATPPLVGLGRYATPSDGHAYEILATARPETGGVLIWSAVVWPGRHGDTAFSLRRWQVGRTGLFASDDDR